MNSIKTEYWQRLPHIQPIGACFFVTFRLFGSIPFAVLKDLKLDYENKCSKAKDLQDEHEKNKELFKIRKLFFAEYDKLLDDIKSGPTYLKIPEILQIVKEELHRFDGEFYNLICYSIMSNHVHILIDTGSQLDAIPVNNNALIENYTTLDIIMKRIKGPTARYSNKVLNLSGRFWEKESFDMYIRNSIMYFNVIRYILNNPVKAGITKDWESHPGNYRKN